MISSRTDCSAAAALAGAIALGEAGESERIAYRAHVAACERCLGELGGEREIERVMAAVAHARDDERWEPDVRKSLARPKSRWILRWGAALAAGAAVVAILMTGEKKAPPAAPQPVAISAQEARALAALDTHTAPRREVRAESLVVGSEVPVATAVAVAVDNRGAPLRCTITRSSGYRSLDQAVCRAALRIRYPAKTDPSP